MRKALRVLLVGDFTDGIDEGFKNVAHHLESELSRTHEVSTLNVKKVTTVAFWRSVTSQNPHVIHYITAPRITSLIFLRMLTLFLRRRPVTVISALSPKISINWWRIIKRLHLAPNMVLTQTEEGARRLLAQGILAAQLPNGVDSDLFVPVAPEEKQRLRREFGIDEHAIVVLHVGHLTKQRRLDLMNVKLSSHRIHYLVVAGTYLGVDKRVMASCLLNGFDLRLGYMRNIEQAYALADCYFFPVEIGSTIEMPLSVIEAMSSNLFVIGRNHAGLTSFHSKEHGMFLGRTDQELQMLLKEGITAVLEGRVARTRQLVKGLHWRDIALKLGNLYHDLRQSARGEVGFEHSRRVRLSYRD